MLNFGVSGFLHGPEAGLADWYFHWFFSIKPLELFNACIASHSVRLKSAASVNPEILIIWLLRLVPRQKVSRP